jgi:transposase
VDDVSDSIAKPSYDAWVGVDHEVVRFVKTLEAELNNLNIRLQYIELEHREQIARRDQVIADKDARIKRLEREVFLLREKADLTSRNSSKPPSLDPPSTPKRAPRVKGKRGRGGQPGHAFHARPLVPAEQVAPGSIVDHKPEHCAACGHGLAGEDPEPTRH